MYLNTKKIEHKIFFNLIHIFLEVISLTACTPLPARTLFVTNFGYPFPPPLLTSFLMAPKACWKSMLSLICIQLFWVIDHIFATNIFVMDNFYSLQIDHSFLIAIIYSSHPNRRVAWNKHGGGKDEPFLTSVVPGISMVGRIFGPVTVIKRRTK